MKKKKPFDIYNPGKKKKGQKKKPSSKPAPAPKKAEKKVSVSADKEINLLLSKIYDMENDLEKRIDKICALSGMSRNEVLTFVENPDNFPSNEWSTIQKRKEALERKMFSSMGLPFKKNVVGKKKLDKKTKKRKGKTLGDRKGWMKM